MQKFSLQRLVEAAGNKMRADLEELMVDHPGELGVGREEVFRRFLRSYLPPRFEISTGFVFDSHGEVSKQLDVIIANGMESRCFETAGGNRYYPCETVVAVGQVKSALTSRKELDSALDNLESVKRLDRSAAGRAFDPKWGEAIDHKVNHLHQIFTFLFVSGRSLSRETMHDELWHRVLRSAPHVWTNVVVALERYLVTFVCDDGVCPNPMHVRGLALQPSGEGVGLLIRFYLLLGQAIEVTRVSHLPYWDYLDEANSWSAMVRFSCTDDPPPYLGSITTG